MTDPQTFEAALVRLREALELLPDKPEETPESTLRALWHAAAGNPVSVDLAAENELPDLTREQKTLLESLISQRLSGTPLGHITQRQHFMGLEMLAGPGALIPRKETELLARTAIELTESGAARALRVIDVCTGSGNVALSIAKARSKIQVFAADLGPEAVELARRNAAHLGVSVDFRVGDLLSPFDSSEFHGNIDLVTCNPPYIASTKVDRMPSEISSHEPRLAFDGGPFGVGILMRLLQESPKYLREGGWLAFEVGLGQGVSMTRLLGKMPEFTNARGVADTHGDVRVVVAQRAGA